MTSSRSFCSYMRSWCSETTSENSNLFLIKQISWGENDGLQRTHKKMLFSNQIYHGNSSVVKKDGRIIATRCIEFTCTNTYLRGQYEDTQCTKNTLQCSVDGPTPAREAVAIFWKPLLLTTAPMPNLHLLKGNKKWNIQIDWKRIFQKQEPLSCKHEKRF